MNLIRLYRIIDIRSEVRPEIRAVVGSFYCLDMILLGTAVFIIAKPLIGA